MSSFGMGIPGFCRDRTKAEAKSYSPEYHRSDSVGLLKLSLKGQFLLIAFGEDKKEKRQSKYIRRENVKGQELHIP